MTSYEKAYYEFKKLEKEYIDTNNYIRLLETDCDVVVDQYMNGDFWANGNIGRIQRRYEVAINRERRKADRIREKMRKLQTKVRAMNSRYSCQ